MAYTADTLAYEVINEMGPRELKGPVWMLGHKYILPRGESAESWLAGWLAVGVQLAACRWTIVGSC